MDQDISDLTEPQGVKDASDAAFNVLLPKSKVIYDGVYNRFREWCKQRKTEIYTEDVLLDYFDEKAKSSKSSTLWSHYSMIKSCLMANDNIDISKYLKVTAFLKRKSSGYQATTSKILTRQQIEKFLLEANDEQYLMVKVALIFGIIGACRGDELAHLEIDDIEDLGSCLIIRIPDPKIIQRTFIVKDNEGNLSNILDLYRRYAALRPSHTKHRRFFVNYKSGKCSIQVVGKNTFGKIPSQVARYLQLPNPKFYTGHCFRKTSASLAAAEGYNKKSIKFKKKLANQFTELMDTSTSTSTSSSKIASDNINVDVSSVNKQRKHPSSILKNEQLTETLENEDDIYAETTSFESKSEGVPKQEPGAPLPTSTILLPEIIECSQASTSTSVADPFSNLEEPSCSSRVPASTSASPTFITLEPLSSGGAGSKVSARGSKDRIYCRLCLKQAYKNSLTPMSDVDINYYGKNENYKKKTSEKVQEIQKMLKFCLPFYDSLTFNPIICSVCLTRLKSSYDFATECLKNQRLIEKYAETNSTTEKIININEMIESNFTVSNDANLSDKKIEVPTTKVLESSENIRQKERKKYSHEESPAAKKQKISHEARDGSLSSSNEVAPNIKIEPDEDDQYAIRECSTKSGQTEIMDPNNVDIETLIKVEPVHVDYPDFIKVEANDETSLENYSLNTRTGIGSDATKENSNNQSAQYVPLDSSTIPISEREPVFANIDFNEKAASADVVKIKLETNENS